MIDDVRYKKRRSDISVYNGPKIQWWANRYMTSFYLGSKQSRYPYVCRSLPLSQLSLSLSLSRILSPPSLSLLSALVLLSICSLSLSALSALCSLCSLCSLLSFCSRSALPLCSLCYLSALSALSALSLLSLLSLWSLCSLSPSAISLLSLCSLCSLSLLSSSSSSSAPSVCPSLSLGSLRAKFSPASSLICLQPDTNNHQKPFCGPVCFEVIVLWSEQNDAAWFGFNQQWSKQDDHSSGWR